jgi:hypothetical protein
MKKMELHRMKQTGLEKENKERKRGLPAGWKTRRELAVEYFPAADERVAVARLHRWIVSDPHLLADLHRRGYRHRQRAFTPLQVKVFRRYL